MEELLLSKGFKLNQYPQGKFYEYETCDENIMQNILGNDYFGDEENLIIQISEDLSKKKICANCNVWELGDKELEAIVSSI